ncbi:MAG: hypothetical protein ACO1SV_25180 [Fimbriimonas sp.]
MAWTAELDGAFSIAWSDPPPPLIERWGGLPYGEERELYDAFNGRIWDEVRCKDLPSWFSPEGYLDQRQCGYYIASYARCSLVETRSEHQARALNIVYDFLTHQLSEPETTMSPLRAAAFAMYIEATREVALGSEQEWRYEVVRRWPIKVFEICRQHTEYI